ncbi:MAG TPA: BamA/TamA family outer membrane protein [Bacteroidota bacterium]
MKKTLSGLTVFVFLLSGLQLADGQTQSNRSKDDDQSDDVGERVGRKIERFISEITGEFTHDHEVDAFLADTLPDNSKKHDVDLDLEDERKTRTFEGDKTIPEHRTVRSNVVVKGGDLTVYGKIDGDVLVVGGSLYVKDGGRITGNARVINGDIVREDGGIIEGYADKTSSRTVGYRENRHRFTHPSNSFTAPWISENANLDNFIVRYNRVEGLFLGLGSEKKFNWDGRRSFNSYGSVGWGIRSHTWRGNLGIVRQFSLKTTEGDELLELGVEGYSLTDSKDQWLIDVHENSAAALLIHEDFRDYYERNGFSAHVAYYGQNDDVKTELKLAYLADKYASLGNNTEWAMFGGEKLFRPNPAINDGSMRSILAYAGFSTENKTSRGPGGWSVFGSFEYGPRSLGGKFNFDQYIFDVRRYQPLSSYDNLNLRLRAGTSDGTLPIQKTYNLGGLGTLSGFPFKSETGNRMILFNAEYIVNGTFLDDLDFWPTWLFRNVNLLFFTDAGWMRTATQSSGPTEGFENITWNEFKHDVGAGFSNRSGSFRIGLAWRTDVKAPARFVMRFTRPF